ncbi:hypothetical protein [Nonomuraea sp. NPDC050691]|uniref:hypothetical protein n=1 Tax=Nonomuraea sp. NPDC050691 TaxID=3155661 RepID=UPI0033EE50DA
MSEKPPIESRWARRVRHSAEALLVVLGTVLLVMLSLTDLLAWAGSPQGLNLPAFFAWLSVLVLALAPVGLALQAGQNWREGYRASKTIAAAWGMIALGVLAQWAAGASWGEIVFRPVVLAVMLWYCGRSSVSTRPPLRQRTTLPTPTRTACATSS